MKVGQGWLLCGLLVGGITSAAATSDENNVGQSFAHPLARLDLRAQYIDLPHGFAANVLTARLDRPFNLTAGWKLNTRVSVTGVISDVPGRDNPGQHWHAGTGDLFTQLLVISPAVGGTSFGFGVRGFFPTAGEDQLGKGKYRVAPLLVAIRFPHWLPSGSFIGIGVRNEFSYAGDAARRDIDELQLVPFTTINMPKNFFVSMSPTIRLAWAEHNRVFVPLDLELGRKLDASRVVSLRMQVPIIDELDPYDWTLEARVSFFF